MSYRSRRVASWLCTGLVVGLCAGLTWAQEVTRAVPDLPKNNNLLIYSLVTVGVLTIGVVVVGFKGTKPSR